MATVSSKGKNPSGFSLIVAECTHRKSMSSERTVELRRSESTGITTMYADREKDGVSLCRILTVWLRPEILMLEKQA